MARSDKPHYAKGESERQLFCEDAFALLALLDLPAAEFKAMSFKRMRADKYGNITLDVYGKVILDNWGCRNSTLWQRTCRP